MSLGTLSLKNLSFRQVFISAFFLSLFVFYPALSGSFILDDWTFISDNLALSEAAHPFHFWASFDQADYWPLTYSLLWLMWKLFKFSWTYYHITNISFHALNATLVAWIGKRYQLKGTLLAALIFLIHPAQLQAVAWIFQIKTLMATTFLLGSWYLYLKDDENSKNKSLGLFFLALCSKTSVVTFPIVLLLHELSFRKEKKLFLSKAEVKRILPFFSLGALFTFTTLWTNHVNFMKRGIQIWNGTPVERFALIWQNLGHYLKSFFLPIDLRFSYPRELPVKMGLSGLITMVLLAFLVVFIAKKGRDYQNDGQISAYLHTKKRLFLVFCYLATLLPVLGLVNIPYMKNSFVADHWHYLSFSCLVLLFADFFVASLNKLKTKWIPVAIGMSTGALILLTEITFHQAQYYKNEEILWKQTLSKDPTSAFSWNCLGVYYLRWDRDAEAEGAFQKAASIDPSEQPALFNLAVLADRKNDPDRAKALLTELLRLDKTDNRARIFLSRLNESAKF
ncbi:MAG: tetratricopeptide repeat protein [Bdellovibrionia bacterium]